MDHRPDIFSKYFWVYGAFDIIPGSCICTFLLRICLEKVKSPQEMANHGIVRQSLMEDHEIPHHNSNMDTEAKIFTELPILSQVCSQAASSPSLDILTNGVEILCHDQSSLFALVAHFFWIDC